MTTNEMNRLPLVQGVVAATELPRLIATHDPYRLAPFVRDITWLTTLKPRLPLEKRPATCLARAQHGTL